jgi:hypothetical protein
LGIARVTVAQLGVIPFIEEQTMAAQKAAIDGKTLMITVRVCVFDEGLTRLTADISSGFRIVLTERGQRYESTPTNGRDDYSL